MKKNKILFGVLVAAACLVTASDAQSVMINEAYSRGVAGDLDWIEVYNTTSTPVDIGGYKIYDSGAKGGAKGKKLFPGGTILPAFGFAAIVTDTATFVGDTTAFGLSSSGETVWLENAAGVLIDTCIIPALGSDTSIARIPDGSGIWMKTTPRTKGGSNVLVKMNEIYSRGVAGALDWIEIHNGSLSAIDISGYKIYDSGAKGGAKGKKLFPNGTIVPANGFTVIITDTATFVGDTTAFGLSSSGETVWLENTAGVLIDTVVIPALGIDTSYARVPDGSNVMMKRTPLTRGASNGTGMSVTDESGVVRDFALRQNYPNPFNPSTTIRYSLRSGAAVRVTVFDLLGKEIGILIDERQQAGEHAVQFHAGNHASGVYFYLLNVNGYSEMKKMVLIK